MDEGLRASTARTQLQSIFAKTSVSRQRELLMRLTAERHPLREHAGLSLSTQ